MRKQKLMTKELEELLKKNPLYSHEGNGKDAEILIKYFNPYGVGTWLVTEGNKLEDGDWEFFGWVNLGYEWECGYFTLSQLEEIRIDCYGYKFPIEREYRTHEKTVGEYIERRRCA
jgi:hypothetical protein